METKTLLTIAPAFIIVVAIAFCYGMIFERDYTAKGALAQCAKVHILGGISK